MPKSPQSEVAKITRLEQDTTTTGCFNFRSPPQKLGLNSVESSKNKNHAYHSNQRIVYQPLEQNGNSNGRAPGLSPSAWPTLQQSKSHKQPFLVPWTSSAILMNSNSNVPKRECSGTGVFLPMPRPVATTPSETSRKKQPGTYISLTFSYFMGNLFGAFRIRFTRMIHYIFS